MTTAEPDLVTLKNHLLGLHPAGRRILVAIAGAPASGKSTLAAQLVETLNTDDNRAVVMPMDGFHLDNAILRQRSLLDRKGAPETFDAAGFVQMIHRLTQEDEVAIPLFDRERDMAIAGAALVEAHHRIVIVEGNYLLFDESPWSALRQHWDLAIRLDVPLPVLEERLIRRWRDHGLDDASAIARARQNDIPNAQRVLDRSLPADLVLV